MPTEDDYIRNIRYYLSVIRDGGVRGTYEYELKLLVQLKANGYDIKGDLKHLLCKVKAIAINQ